jgi:hypothetical protein
MDVTATTLDVSSPTHSAAVAPSSDAPSADVAAAEPVTTT